MSGGEVRFAPERWAEPTKWSSDSEGCWPCWYSIGEENYYTTFEQAKQAIDKYKEEHPNLPSSEKIHYVD